MTDDLREQVARAIAENEAAAYKGKVEPVADAVLAVFAEYKQSLRERIERIPHTRAWVPDAEGEARNRGLDEALAEIDNYRKATNA